MMHYPPPRVGRFARAFSLVEVLLAIAILTGLLLGIDFVFRSTRQAISAGEALSSAARSSRSAHTVLYNDLKAAMSAEGPFFIIHSQRQAAFLRSQDHATDSDKDPETLDLDGDGQFSSFAENLASTPTAASYRNCRTDILGFFARDLHRKQTGTGQQIVSPMGSSDAFVWYGHVLQPGVDVNGPHYNLGQADPAANPRNYYASDWILGRTVLLLSTFTIDHEGVNQAAIDTKSGGPLLLAVNSTASAEANNNLKAIQSSRHDLVATTVEELSAVVRNLEQASPDTWWGDLIYRFHTNTSPRLPLNGDSAALAAPVLLPNCRQFLVEYAGDFVTQLTDVRGTTPGSLPDGEVTSHDINDPRYGQVIAAEPDGRIDFHTIRTNATLNYSHEQVAERMERIRFYGFPRDAESIGTIPGAGASVVSNDLVNVVPLRDVVHSGAAANSALAGYAGAPFERRLPPLASDYAAPGATTRGAVYTCVWGPDDPRPQLLRIIVSIEDPQNSMGVGQTHEYILQINR